jgi:hypothetical protein
MNYYTLLNQTKNYLTSIRIIKDHVSFDLVLPNTWVIPKKYTEGENVSVVKNSNDSVSFVCKFDENSVNDVEKTIKDVIQYNIDKEEKENLFRNKVKELKGIFDREDIDGLRSLKFEFDEIKNMLKDNKNESEDTERVAELQESGSDQ